MLDGIDVSEYQPPNIGDLVPYDFLIAKATEGESYVNPYHAQQVASALDRGKRAGLYHFASGRSVANEVSAFCRAFDPYLGRAIPFLDWEGSALAAGSTWRQAWLDSASRSLGIRPALYGSLSVVGGVSGEALWIAAYGSNPVTYGYQNPANIGGIMRQYTSQGRLSGYAGNLDLNKFWGTGADWDNLAGVKAPAPKPVDIPVIRPDTKEGEVKTFIRRASDGSIALIDSDKRTYSFPAWGEVQGYLANGWKYANLTDADWSNTLASLTRA